MKNTLRSRAFMKIKRTINSCETKGQCESALNMILLHKNIAESDILMRICREKYTELKIDYYEDETLTAHHAKNCGGH